MVTIPAWFIRYGPPTAFLLAATIAVLALRAAVHHESAAPAKRQVRMVTTRSPEPSRTKAVRASAYSVRSGDTLATIAGRFGTSVDRIIELNPGIDPNALRVGQALRVD